jgi:hypothetical protein
MAASHLLALLALAAAADPPPRLVTPPLPFGVVCGPMPVRDLGAIPLTTETTYAEVVAAWGEPLAYGPAHELSIIGLTCDAALWLSFAPGGERRLTRAILITGSFVPITRVILDTLDTTHRRRCGQLRPGARRGAEIARAWGPPDNEIGSGMVRFTYAMADGGFAQVFPVGNDRFMVGCWRR